MISPELQQWVIRCLLVRVPMEHIITTMVENYHVPQNEVLTFIQMTTALPLFQVAQETQQELENRDWILEQLGHVFRLAPSFQQIERVENLSLDDFFHHYYSANRPVVLTKAVEHWPAMEKWSFPYLKERWGDIEVEVQMGRESDPRYDQHHDQLATQMKFADYLDKCLSVESSNDFYMTSRNMRLHKEALEGIVADITPLPPMLTEEFSGTIAFLWVGPKGTITQLHHDMSNNLHTQIVGSKRLLMADPFQMPYMYHYNNYWSRVPYPEYPDLIKYPKFQSTKFFEAVLEPGDSIFIPVFWWHYVEALKPSITVAFHNFIYPNNYTSFMDGRPFQYHQD